MLQACRMSPSIGIQQAHPFTIWRHLSLAAATLSHHCAGRFKIWLNRTPGKHHSRAHLIELLALHLAHELHDERLGKCAIHERECEVLVAIVVEKAAALPDSQLPRRLLRLHIHCHRVHLRTAFPSRRSAIIEDLDGTDTLMSCGAVQPQGLPIVSRICHVPYASWGTTNFAIALFALLLLLHVVHNWRTPLRRADWSSPRKPYSLFRLLHSTADQISQQQQEGKLLSGRWRMLEHASLPDSMWSLLLSCNLRLCLPQLAGRRVRLQISGLTSCQDRI